MSAVRELIDHLSGSPDLTLDLRSDPIRFVFSLVTPSEISSSFESENEVPMLLGQKHHGRAVFCSDSARASILLRPKRSSVISISSWSGKRVTLATNS